MRIRLILSLVALGLVAGRGAADDAKAVVEKAIKAHGGEEKLTKYKAAKVKAKGTLQLMGTDIEFTADASTMFPDRYREEIKMDIMGNKLEIVQVFDGKKGWVSTQGMTMEVQGAQLDELKDQAYGNYLESLVPLVKEKQFELTLLDETKVDGKAAVGVKVASKGHKDIKMYFNKESGLLVKTEHKAVDPGMQEVEAETYYRDYKDVSGTKQAMKQLVKHDGKKFLEAEVTEIKLMEKIDASTFEKP
jgi:hypothetical protein